MGSTHHNAVSRGRRLEHASTNIYKYSPPPPARLGVVKPRRASTQSTPGNRAALAARVGGGEGAAGELRGGGPGVGGRAGAGGVHLHKGGALSNASGGGGGGCGGLGGGVWGGGGGGGGGGMVFDSWVNR